MLYIMLAHLMLFAALSNAVCLYNASFFHLFLQMLSCFVYCHIVCLFHVLTCTMHSAFNMLVFPNSMFTSLLLFFIMKGLCTLRRNST